MTWHAESPPLDGRAAVAVLPARLPEFAPDNDAHLGLDELLDAHSPRERERGLLAPPSAGVLPGTLSYRSIRGSPKCGKVLLPPNQVIAAICRPSRVRTSIP
jgi:hypothetical protein